MQKIRIGTQRAKRYQQKDRRRKCPPAAHECSDRRGHFARITRQNLGVKPILRVNRLALTCYNVVLLLILSLNGTTMRLNRFIILLAFLLLTVTACTQLNSTATPTPGGVLGIPTYETPEGLLPAALEAGSDPAPTMQPVEEVEFQTVEMPDLGVSITIPAGWTSKRSDDVYLIEDADGQPVMQVGAAY